MPHYELYVRSVLGVHDEAMASYDLQNFEIAAIDEVRQALSLSTAYNPKGNTKRQKSQSDHDVN